MRNILSVYTKDSETERYKSVHLTSRQHETHWLIWLVYCAGAALATTKISPNTKYLQSL